MNTYLATSGLGGFAALSGLRVFGFGGMCQGLDSLNLGFSGL